MDWLAALPAREFATTTINIAEVRFGLAGLPFGRRRAEREAMFNGFLAAHSAIEFSASMGWRRTCMANSLQPASEGGGLCKGSMG